MNTADKVHEDLNEEFKEIRLDKKGKSTHVKQVKYLGEKTNVYVRNNSLADLFRFMTLGANSAMHSIFISDSTATEIEEEAIPIPPLNDNPESLESLNEDLLKEAACEGYRKSYMEVNEELQEAIRVRDEAIHLMETDLRKMRAQYKFLVKFVADVFSQA
jgi:hypothetical protein